MTKHGFGLVAAYALLVWAQTCSAVTPATLSPAAKAFETECLDVHKDCIYENIRFESIHEVRVERHFYRIVKDEQDIDAYNTLMRSILAPYASLGVVHAAAYRYDLGSQAWILVHGTRICRYCTDATALGASRSTIFRVDLNQRIEVGPDAYIALGSMVYRNQNLKERIIVSAPALFHPDDHSFIYMESRIKGRHEITSFNNGGTIIELDGDSVPGPIPDFVAISPVKSWSLVAAEFRKRETALLQDAVALPDLAQGPLTQRIDRVAHQLQAHHIRYNAFVGGAFPSVTPRDTIDRKQGDCKALATLATWLLERSGVKAHAVIIGESLLPPLSFTVPGHFWGTLHVLLYLPALDLYVDPTYITSFSADWKTSAERYRGAVGLDIATGSFVVIH